MSDILVRCHASDGIVLIPLASVTGIIIVDGGRDRILADRELFHVVDRYGIKCDNWEDALIDARENMMEARQRHES